MSAVWLRPELCFESGDDLSSPAYHTLFHSVEHSGSVEIGCVCGETKPGAVPQK